MTQEGGKLALSGNTIDLWYCYDTQIQDTDLLARYHQLLNDEEAIKQRRFHFARDRHQYLVTRALVRSVLSMYMPMPPKQWQFTKNQYGRPEIAAHQAAVPLRFNLSHTRGLIICGVTLEHDIGVDVETLDRSNDTVGIADRYFSSLEVEELLRHPKDNQKQRFFDYWTLKESYIKARGMGLSIPLDQFSFHLEQGQPIRISFDPRLDDTPDQWQFWQFLPENITTLPATTQAPCHKIAMAIRSPADFKIRHHKIIPLDQ